MKKSISLSLRKCKVNGDMCRVTIRDYEKDTIFQEDYASFEEAFKFFINETKEEDNEIKVPEELCSKKDNEIKDYVNGNNNKKGVRSARHLNKKFNLQRTQEEYNSLLNG